MQAVRHNGAPCFRNSVTDVEHEETEGLAGAGTSRPAEGELLLQLEAKPALNSIQLKPPGTLHVPKYKFKKKKKGGGGGGGGRGRGDSYLLTSPIPPPHNRITNCISLLQLPVQNTAEYMA